MAESFGAVADRWCIVLIVVERDGSLVLVAEPTRVAVPCPRCGELSRRQHSRYERHPLDLPWRGHTVRMRVHTRRWFCDVPSCPRKIFAERFDGVLAHYARRTNGTTELLTTFALQAGAEGGARLARKAGVPISPDTLLRLLHALTDADDTHGPRVLGVDDVALRRKQRRYGTLLILWNQKSRFSPGVCPHGLWIGMSRSWWRTCVCWTQGGQRDEACRLGQLSRGRTSWSWHVGKALQQVIDRLGSFGDCGSLVIRQSDLGKHPL